MQITDPWFVKKHHRTAASGALPQWTLVQHVLLSSSGATTSATRSLALSSTGSGHVLFFGFRCGSATSQNECHPTLAKTYNGSVSSNTCTGSIVDTITIDTYGQSTVSNPLNNAAIGHLIGTSSGGTCLQVTRNVTTSDTWFFGLQEWSYAAGGSPSLDGTAQQTLNVTATGSNPYYYAGQALTLTGRNDIVSGVCACGVNMASVSPAQWSADYYDHLAFAYVGNVNSSTLVTPTYATSASGSANPGVVEAIAITD